MSFDIKTLFESCRHRVCDWNAGTVLLRQGIHSESLYLVTSGQLRVWVEHPTRSEWVASVGAGHVVGEPEPGVCAATVVARVAGSGLRVRRADLAQMWQTAPDRARQLHAYLGGVGDGAGLVSAAGLF